MTQKVFVYGTLKKGLSNARYMAGQRLLGECRTQPRYRMVDAGGYPGMFPVEEDGVRILGEVWEVDEACRRRLDVLEDVAAGLYALEPALLEEPYAGQGVLTYVYKWPVVGRPDAGDEWRE